MMLMAYTVIGNQAIKVVSKFTHLESEVDPGGMFLLLGMAVPIMVKLDNV